MPQNGRLCVFECDGFGDESTSHGLLCISTEIKPTPVSVRALLLGLLFRADRREMTLGLASWEDPKSTTAGAVYLSRR